MKIKLPESLKADLPPHLWGKVVSSSPVVLTVIATLLAGISSGEMTSAQYELSLATQLQSKAGDQWNFFQGKRLRGALQHSTLDLMASTADVAALDGAALRRALADSSAGTALDSAAGREVLNDLSSGRLPGIGAAPLAGAGVPAALAALDASRPETELAALLVPVTDPVLADALHAAQGQVLAFDAANKAAGQIIDQVEPQLARPGADPTLRRSFAAARLGYNALRYDAEARLNQAVASLYELQVRKSNLSAERHRHRSQLFFDGMLAAQMGVVISTLALATKKRNLLLALAAVAGVAALGIAAYVYLCV